MKLAVVGNKDFKNYSLLKQFLSEYSGLSLIVSGGACGTDTLAKQFAIEHTIKLLEFPPDFVQFGKKAKLICNRKIVDHCDFLIAFF